MIFSSSSSSSQTARRNPFIEPDPTFKSFNSLLNAKLSSSSSSSPSISTTTSTSSTSTTSSHLSLLSPDTLYGSISHFLSHLDSNYTNQFVHSIHTSPGLWQLPVPNSNPNPNPLIQSSNPVSPAAPSNLNLLQRSKDVTNCIAYSVTKRVDLLISSRNGSTNWSTRRIFTSWLNQITTAFNPDGNHESSKSRSDSVPVSKLSIMTGLLQGLQSVKATRKKNNGLGLNVNYHIRLIEDEWLVAFAECLEAIQSICDASEATNGVKEDEWEKEFKKMVSKGQNLEGQESAMGQLQAREERARSNALTPIYLSSLVLPFITPSKQEALPSGSLIQIFSDSLISMLSSSSLLSTLSSDLISDSDGLVICIENSETSKKANQLLEQELFSVLGSVSRILADGIGRAVRNSRPEEISLLLLGEGDESNAFLNKMLNLSSQWEKSWKSSRLNRLDEKHLSESNDTKKITTSLWKIFKSFLFSQTMIFDSLVESIVDMCPSPTITLPLSKSPTALTLSETEIAAKWKVQNTSNLSSHYLSMISKVLKIYSSMFWVTSSFGISPMGGPAGFETYRKVFYSSLDVLGRDELRCTKVVQDMAYAYFEDGGEIKNAERLTRDPNLGMDDDSITYFLDLVEQLIVVLSDEIIEDLILPICRRYLTDDSNPQPFESAHSVVLAIYEHDKGCVTEFSPFYVQLLLESFPGRMTAEQQEHAFTTVTSAVSERSDAITWWILKKLEEEISKARFEVLGITPSTTTKTAIPTLKRIESDYQSQESEEKQGEGERDERDEELKSSIQQSSLSPISSIPSSEEAKESPSSSTQMSTLNRQTVLQLLYIGQLPNVNLVLLPSALRRIKEYISSETKGSTQRMRLCEKCWEGLGGLDASTREEGTRWWLANREDFGV